MKAIVRKGTYGDTVLKIALECGCVSGRAEKIICEPSRLIHVQKAIDNLKAGMLVETNGKKKDNHAVTINSNSDPARERLTELYGAEALAHYDRVTHGRLLTTAARQRWGRAMRMSEVIAIMQRYGYTPYSYEKENVPWSLNVGVYDIYNILYPHFFTFREIKKMMNNTNVFGYTRINGILASEGGIYTIYNYGDTHYSWNNKGELNAATTLMKFIEHYYQRTFGDEVRMYRRIPGAIVFGNDMDVAERYLLDPFAVKGRTRRRKRKIDSEEQVYTPPSIYERIYIRLHFIPLNYDGIQALRVLTIKNWKEIMRDNFYPKTANAPRNDPYDLIYVSNKGTEHVLCFTDCDLHRLHAFMMLDFEREEDLRVVICYNWQRKLVERIASEMEVEVTIKDYETDTILSNFEDEFEAQDERMKKHHYMYPITQNNEDSPYSL